MNKLGGYSQYGSRLDISHYAWLVEDGVAGKLMQSEIREIVVTSFYGNQNEIITFFFLAGVATCVDRKKGGSRWCKQWFKKMKKQRKVIGVNEKY